MEGNSVRIRVVPSEGVDDAIGHCGEGGGRERTVVIVLYLFDSRQTGVVEGIKDRSVGICAEASVQDLRGLAAADGRNGS